MTKHNFPTRRTFVVALCLGLLVLALGAMTASADSQAIDFETYTVGDINGQDGWMKTGGYDVAVVDQASLSLSYPGFGSRSLRISNATVSGSFGDQTFSKSLVDEAGETSATNGGLSGGTRQTYYEAQWEFASTVPGAEQPGLYATGTPDRGDGARMSWVMMADTPTGLEVRFNDYASVTPGTCDGVFTQTVIAPNLDRTVKHSIRMTMEFIDGTANDVVKVYVDGALVHTGTSWEDYFRDCQPPDTHTVDSILFRVGGQPVDARPATLGKGFLIDNFSQTSGPVPCTTICYVSDAAGNDLNGGASASDAKKTIQAAVNTVNAGGQVIVLPGTYPENVIIPKSLTLDGAGDGTNPAVDTILEGTGKNGVGIFINTGITGVTIQDLRVQNYTGASSTGIWGDGSNSDFTAQNLTVHNNGNGSIAGGGIRLSALAGIDNVLITGNTLSNNTGRGFVIWDGYKSNITITNNTVTGNNCCGIELQDGTASGVTVTGNTVTNQGDSGMAFTGLMTGDGPNVIANNTVTNNGRFGIEIKLPNGTGLATGDGSIVVEDNTVSRTVAPTDGPQRDYAGIAVFRRGYVAGYNNVDIPTGVIVRNNTVSGYQQPSTSDGFGIVVEGTNMTVTGNTLNNNDVGVQVQAGHTPYFANAAGDGDQANLADQFFGRGNSPVGCALLSPNTFSGNTVNTRNVNAGGGIVTNVDTGETFCSIQAAVDDSDTVNGHTIEVPAGVFAENVTVSKKITLDGAGSGSDPAVDTLIDPVAGRGLMITASGASAADRLVIKDLRVTGATDDGITLEGTGGSYLTLDNVASVGQTGSGSDGFEIKHLQLVTDVKIINSNLSGNGLSGFRMGTGTMLNGLTVENTTFNGNQYGVNIYAANPAPTFTNITFTDVTITNNTQKGVYTERLNNATFSGLVVTGNGSAAGTFLAGIDINLKYAAFTNITIEDSTFQDNGLGDTNNTGVDLTIKVRNDGAYAGSPATLTNLDVNHVTFGGTSDIAMSLGNNLDQATTTVNNNAFGGTNTAGLVVFGTLPVTMVNVTCNWWDAADGPSGVGPGSGNTVSANADFSPWLYTDDLDGDCYMPGTITVVKQTTPDGDTTDFEFDPSWSATNFMLADGEDEDSPGLNPNDGPFSVAEVNVPTGWVLTDAECTNGVTTAAPTSIPLAEGESWTCTFNNAQQGTITVAKETTPDGDLTEFDFDPSWTADFALSDGESVTSAPLMAGAYSVAEINIPLNWTLNSATCDNTTTVPVETGDPSAITVADGDAWVCTFNNSYDAPGYGNLYIAPNRNNGVVDGVPYNDEDIVVNTLGTSDWAMYFDGSDVGITKNLTDFTFTPDGCMLMTFNGNQNVPGVGLVKPQDLVKFCPTSTGPVTDGTFTMYFDGSDVGLASAGEIIDAVDLLPNGDLVISTKASSNIPNPPAAPVKAKKNDLLVFHGTQYGPTTTGSWDIYFNNVLVPGLKKENIISLYIDGVPDKYVSFWDKYTNVGGLSGDANDILIIHPDNTVTKFWEGSDWGYTGRVHGLHIVLEIQ